ncbi:MAG: hypothetical protein IIC76_12190 [Bacteroidetes bacterium]|nr:hypothetical protein [Bacteroidota bacterium]
MDNLLKKLREFIKFISDNDGIGNKQNLILKANEQFELIKDRTIYYCDSFAVRFSYSSKTGFSNTVLSLSKLQKFDNVPVLVCLVTQSENKIFIANSTFLTKISHSSHQLRTNNIKGSFNGSDIIKSFNDIENNRDNIESLFAIHSEIGFEGNLVRLVEATNNISPSGNKFLIGSSEKLNVFSAVDRAIFFNNSAYFLELQKDLDERVKKYENEILVASHIENVNIRGRIIEYLILDDNDELKRKLINEIKNEYSRLPHFKTDNTLGDYRKIFENHLTETDVKTKIMILNSNPKAYNIDKFLEFLSRSNTIFLLYFIGIDAEEIVNKVLVSVFQKDLLKSTIVLKHWAGRNSRGVTQFVGTTIHELILNSNNAIERNLADDYLEKLIEL